MIATEWPLTGSVIVVRAHESAGPLGWFRNERNRAVGWYWHLCVGDNERNGPVVKRRGDAFRGAEAVFSNIVGWKMDDAHHFHAEIAVREHKHKWGRSMFTGGLEIRRCEKDCPATQVREAGKDKWERVDRG